MSQMDHSRRFAGSSSGASGGGAGSSGRSFTFNMSVGGPGRGGVLSAWLARCLVASVGAVVIVLAFIFLLPLAALGVAAAVVVGGVLLVRNWWRRQRRPNGMLDGRRNVRVRVPSEPA